MPGGGFSISSTLGNIWSLGHQQQHQQQQVLLPHSLGSSSSSGGGGGGGVGGARLCLPFRKSQSALELGKGPAGWASAGSLGSEEGKAEDGRGANR